ncbi:MAG TPA: hypothetical protein VF263_01920, partial [Longimicrobiaceae bacterium]
TPMLVDALDDGIPLWPPGSPPLRVRFGPEDALRCTAALLRRVAEGGEEVAERLGAGEPEPAWRRMRDDLVRLCTAGLLLAGETRPRRGDAVRRFLRRAGGGAPPGSGPLLRWAAGSYGPDDRDDEGPVAPPPGGAREAAALIDLLRGRVRRWARELARATVGRNPARRG